MTPQESPVFLVGPLRAGTTMLRLMLDSHPRLSNMGEFEYAVKYHECQDDHQTDRFAALLERDRAFRAANLPIDHSLSYAELVRSFLEHGRCRSGKEIPGATVHSRFDLLLNYWPHARFIHLVRDPRDVARSCIGMGWVGNVWYGADYWLDAENRWQAMCPNLKDGTWIDVRYEDLVVNAEAELRRVCDWLSIEYSNCMFDYQQNSTYGKPDSTLANQWRREMSSDEIAWVEHRCGPLMVLRGYEHATVAGAPTFTMRLKNYLQNRTSRVTFNVRRYGVLLYLKWQVAKRLRRSQPAFSLSVQHAVDAVDQLHLK